MKIAICGSMQFHKEMRDIKKILESKNHVVLIPKGVKLMDSIGYKVPSLDEARVDSKIEHDFIREHFRKIGEADAILVLNHEKKSIKNYIGGNTFLEVGIAFWLNKKIFFLNPIPKMDYFTELAAMRPVILNGNLDKIN